MKNTLVLRTLPKVFLKQINAIIQLLKKDRLPTKLENRYYLSEKIKAAGLVGISRIDVDMCTTLKNGWLVAKVVYDSITPEDKEHRAERWENIVKNKINSTTSADRSSYVKVELEADKVVFEVRIGHETKNRLGMYEESFFVIDSEYRLIESKFANLECFNWDNNSEEALLSLETHRKELRYPYSDLSPLDSDEL
jgi:tRNA threonylcarbamoyladenosine modification (KEOPS) complex  Pcc1 subunit